MEQDLVDLSTLPTVLQFFSIHPSIYFVEWKCHINIFLSILITCV